jgi:uncharacterized protein (DUF1015 family)
MPAVFPFSAVQFKSGAGDVSSLVAPPYDVLDAAGKKALLSKDQHNIVAIDLPHTPAKELGPPEAYQAAGAAYREWLANGTLRRTPPAMFAYRQTFKTGTKTFQRSGMAAAVETVPFGPRPGGGILPHEETFSGPKEDRLALMKATGAQLSPIFGLFADERGAATKLLQTVMSRGRPDLTAGTADGVTHEIWTITDSATIRSYQDALAGEAIFIADGHHRYNTALNYLKELEARGPVGPDHPARRCMMVMVGMSDPGLVIWPTHRVLGGMSGYSIEGFIQGAKGILNVRPIGDEGATSGTSVPKPGVLAALEAAVNEAGKANRNALGLYDFPTGRSFVATLEGGDAADPLKASFPGKPKAWRTLDVALVQHLVEQVCQPKLNGGQGVKWAFPHTVAEVEAIGMGAETGAGGGKSFKPQLAVILRPTPLQAVREVSAADELMPQKSTFFYPKLATGLFINPLQR